MDYGGSIPLSNFRHISDSALLRCRNCCRNPVDSENIAIPSDKDAVREHIFSIDEERRYFSVAARNSNLYDTGRLMINQGFRPEEVWTPEAGPRRRGPHSEGF